MLQAFLATLSGYVVNLPADVSASKVTVAPATVTATVNFNRDGTITDHNGTSKGNWISPRHSTVGDGYDIKYDYGSGDTLSSGAAASGTYIAMTSNRAFSNSASSAIRTTTLTWSIRLTGTGSALDTATGTITAESAV